jgi:uncharacterized damage-inducible protein DinB
MNAVDAIVFNLQETRRRSVLLWRSLPDQWLHWRPDKDAMSFGEMIRHVWAGSHGYHLIVLNNGSLKEKPQLPYDQIPVTSVEEEITLSEPYFNSFLDYVKSLQPEELTSRIIDRSDVGYRRPLGDFLLRIAYHDSVHTGQFLQYMRMLGLERPMIWD